MLIFSLKLLCMFSLVYLIREVGLAPNFYFLCRIFVPSDCESARTRSTPVFAIIHVRYNISCIAG